MAKTIEQELKEIEAKRDKLLEKLEKEKSDGMKYVICRTYSAGVFAGFLLSRKGKEVILKKARRLWYWKGAASLSQLAQSGTSNPSQCKFPEEVETVELTECIELLEVTSVAKKTIEAVPVWRE